MIAPSLLSADFTRLGEEIDLLEAGGADMLHLDIMDGCFVPNISFGPSIVKQIHGITGLPLDVHLMICNPEKYIDAFINSGADIITIHAEATNHLHRLLTYIKAKGKKAGVSINPATPLNAVSEIVSYSDIILVMTVNPGFGGQSFIPEGVDKTRRLKALLKEKKSDALIEVDGGVNDETAPLLWKAGVDILVAGSYIFQTRDYRAAIESIAKRQP
jgi:ribulose-phosphate 3-epimerase